MAHFSRKRFGWGPPKTWQGWVFLGIWSLAFTAVAGQPPSVLGGLLSLGLLAFFLYVVSRDKDCSRLPGAANLAGPMRGAR